MPDQIHAPEHLPEAAIPAWQAYCAMVTSKDDHFRYLEELEQKYRTGGSRTLAEIARLDSLLKEHDRCVSSFTSAMKALATEDSLARSALIELIATVNIRTGMDNASAH
jgi:hypothetical protein